MSKYVVSYWIDQNFEPIPYVVVPEETIQTDDSQGNIQQELNPLGSVKKIPPLWGNKFTRVFSSRTEAEAFISSNPDYFADNTEPLHLEIVDGRTQEQKISDAWERANKWASRVDNNERTSYLIWLIDPQISETAKVKIRANILWAETLWAGYYAAKNSILSGGEDNQTDPGYPPYSFFEIYTSR